MMGRLNRLLKVRQPNSCMFNCLGLKGCRIQLLPMEKVARGKDVGTNPPEPSQRLDITAMHRYTQSCIGMQHEELSSG